MLELVPAKSILARNKDLRWFGIDYQMNLYRAAATAAFTATAAANAMASRNLTG